MGGGGEEVLVEWNELFMVAAETATEPQGCPRLRYQPWLCSAGDAAAPTGVQPVSANE